MRTQLDLESMATKGVGEVFDCETGKVIALLEPGVGPLMTVRWGSDFQHSRNFGHNVPAQEWIEANADALAKGEVPAE
jgi:hypothetical protein